jgi:pilus assembly protein CpaB
MFFLVLVIGMALAGGAVYMVQQHIAETEVLLERERAFNAEAGKLVQVYVFARPMQYGDALAPEDVQQIYWPESALPEAIFQDGALLFPENAPGPRYVMRDTMAFEPVLAGRVTEPGELAGLTSKLKPGMRAFAIRVSVASGVAAFVQPDDYIDVNWTGNINGVSTTRLIESSIQVIAVDKAFNEGQVSTGDANTVTVAATPEQVARLTQAQSSGQLSMSLVGETAEVSSDPIAVDTNSMLGIVEAAPVVQAPEVIEKKCYLQQRSGGVLVDTDVEIPCK